MDSGDRVEPFPQQRDRLPNPRFPEMIVKGALSIAIENSSADEVAVYFGLKFSQLQDLILNMLQFRESC